jgi:hypothetical protein
MKRGLLRFSKFAVDDAIFAESYITFIPIMNVPLLGSLQEDTNREHKNPCKIQACLSPEINNLTTGFSLVLMLLVHMS